LIGERPPRLQQIVNEFCVCSDAGKKRACIDTEEIACDSRSADERYAATHAEMLSADPGDSA
jgi:hypothetical protein